MYEQLHEHFAALDDRRRGEHPELKAQMKADNVLCSAPRISTLRARFFGQRFNAAFFDYQKIILSFFPLI